jgi:signal transduction histidine kinase
MSIRLRLTLLYTGILALTLVLLSIVLYTIQARSTLDSLKNDLRQSGDVFATTLLWRYFHPSPPEREPVRPPPMTFENFSNDQAFQGLREREIVRILSADGTLIASPFGVNEDALPLSSTGLAVLQSQNSWWEIASNADGRLLIYNIPVVADNQIISIVQIARPLAERDNSLAGLRTTLIVASLLTILTAFGIGWVLSGVTLRPIHRITQTAQEIANESDFSQRVNYQGPKDEIGQLAMTFNSMLARLQESYQQVSQTLKMQRDFVADVSHELRTPLTTVRGNLALLRREPPLPQEEQADVLDDLVDESDRLIRLVNGLLVLARADVGLSLIQEPVPVRPVVEEACNQARQLDQDREITEVVQDFVALGDKDALKQVLLILLDNAIKHTVGSIEVSTELVDSQVIISVQDHGPGFPPDKLAHLFDRFYRGDVDPSVPGYGLGLPIAKALVEGQGGTIEIESQMGSGTIVKVSLPRWLT